MLRFRLFISSPSDVGPERALALAVAERLGFTFEGVQRGFMPSSAGPRDYAMYGVTRADHEQRATRT